MIDPETRWEIIKAAWREQRERAIPRMYKGLNFPARVIFIDGDTGETKHDEVVRFYPIGFRRTIEACCDNRRLEVLRRPL